MADKFEEMVRKVPLTVEANVDGAFDCQICDEYVDKAYYDRENSLLVWKCSEGHLSKIKDFNLG